MLTWTQIDEKRMGLLDAKRDIETLTIKPVDIFAYMVRKSQSTLFEVYRHSRKPIEAELISTTALFFFKFYMSESVLSYDPRVVFVACMNLAAKSEEYHSVSLSDLVNSLPDASTLKSVVPLIEMKVLKSLDFDLVVDQPWHVMLFWVDSIRDHQDTSQTYLKLYDTACDILRTWQWTDAVLIYDFPKLATCAVYKACIVVDGRDSLITTSPDEVSSDKWTERFSKFAMTLVPSLNIDDVLRDVESVAYRFGSFEKVVKDPDFEKSDGYKEIVALYASISNR
jgi:hypothetical protein